MWWIPELAKTNLKLLALNPWCKTIDLNGISW